MLSFYHSNYLEAPITSIAQPIPPIVKLAVKLLLEQLNQLEFDTSKDDILKILLPESKLMSRNSVRKLMGG